MDLIPSPSVNIQIMGRNLCLSCKGKTFLVVVNKLLNTKILLTISSKVLLLHLFTHNLNFHWRWRWWDQIHAIFLNLFYFKILSFGPKNIGSNILVKSSQCSSLGDKYLSSLIHGFQLATQAGPLCEEPLSGHRIYIMAVCS